MSYKHGDLSTEELLKLIASSDERVPPNTDQMDEVRKFVLAVDVKEGSNTIEPFNIYYQYSLWHIKTYDVRFRKPYTFQRFNKTFKKLFGHTKKYNGYQLESSLLNFGDDAKWKARRFKYVYENWRKEAKFKASQKKRLN